MNSHILVIEDEVSLSQALCDNLEMCGYSVEAAYDGEEALKKIHSRTPALVITDLLIPKIDGFEVIAELKKTIGCEDVPVIVLSNLDGHEAMRKVFDLGASQYLIKSEHSIQEIMSIVGKCYPRAFVAEVDLTTI